MSSAADIPDEFKSILARLFIALRGYGIGNTVFRRCLQLAGYTVSESQLNRWVARVGSNTSAVLENKQSGAEALLSREQRNVISGWVLDENDHGNLVSLARYIRASLIFFSTNISPSTASSYLAEDEFTYKLVQEKGKSFVVDVEVLRQQAWDWVKKQNFKIRRDRLASGDFTFTSHRTARKRGYAPRGGPQPMESSRVTRYTNCIFTLLWADGVNHTPSILFTFDSDFRQDRNPTQRRAAISDHLRECMEKYNITEDRIIYVGNDKNEKRTYVREGPELLRLFFSVYDIPPGATVFTDEGGAFFENQKSVLESLGFKNHRTYPPDVHQYLSPNDNRLHGTSKRTWRSSDVDHSDDIESCLCLLNLLDRDTIQHGKNWWEKNMLKLTEEGVTDLIGNGPVRLSHLHKSWRAAYESFIAQNKDIEKP
jgi:hypothetical protein